jgi:hypothetical protein
LHSWLYVSRKQVKLLLLKLLINIQGVLYPHCGRDERNKIQASLCVLLFPRFVGWGRERKVCGLGAVQFAKNIKREQNIKQLN